ncbi:MATE family efflux transporter [[Clostridium] polysaccharolyticum]|uniref:Putative efflux protein, MATE family n=1 Tax=[Clostridium] polysaccharolyticum TaxID=29364 RepID=A0A1I0BEV3_9FIRM|nr:MATE family efflux transporter [[Clostridium] polysaccharolyticum]SET05460.1 putative efflux protein, MATE family [[Clostridium] polysaccharolyticum]
MNTQEMEENTLINCSIAKALLFFVRPYLLSCLMQALYGLVDLYVVGLFYPSAITTAVSIGSQVTHMLTVIIVGIAMGTTVKIGNEAGRKDKESIGKTIGATITLFSIIAVCLTLILMLFTKQITFLMLTPEEAAVHTNGYIRICFAGIPFIVAYNVISSIFRGLGDTKHPMYFVGIACFTNICLDFVFAGAFGLGAEGAAIATVCGQAVSVAVSLLMIKKMKMGYFISKENLKPDRECVRKILNIGVPIAMQDGFIQISFLVITAIANDRGNTFAAGVGIVEKIICFLFLVPSSFLSAISTITAQNIGAGKPERAVKALRYGLCITVGWGILCACYCQLVPGTLIGLFSKDAEVIFAGCDYLRAYAIDCIFAAIHFCFSGYFCGCEKSTLSFIHNMISIVLIRIPGAYFASLCFPKSLFPMGLAAPAGSLVSTLICAGFYYWSGQQKRKKLSF